MSRNADRALRLLSRQLDPGWHITSITPSTTSGSWGPNGYDSEHSGHEWYCTTDTGSWCVTVEEDGWESERGRWFMWGHSIAEAALSLAAEIRKRRSNPHLFHVMSSYREGYFLVGCAECEREAAELFSGEVEWALA